MGGILHHPSFHYDFLREICKLYPNCRYLEIGTGPEASSSWAVHEHVDILLTVDIVQPPPVPDKARLFIMSSDEFFETLLVGVFNIKYNVIFIDGEHTFYQVSKDLRNAIKLLSDDGYIILHDIWPMTQRHLQPDACGDVWKILYDKEIDEDFLMFPIKKFPGLLLLQRRYGSGITPTSAV